MPSMGAMTDFRFLGLTGLGLHAAASFFPQGFMFSSTKGA